MLIASSNPPGFSPIIFNHLIITAQDSSQVCAYDFSTLSQVWCSNSLANPTIQGSEEESLYISGSKQDSNSLFLESINVVDGTLKWEMEVNSTGIDPMLCSAPYLDQLSCKIGFEVTQIDLANQTILWTSSLPDPASIPVRDDVNIFSGSSSSSFYSFDLATGSIYWQVDQTLGTLSNATIIDDTVIVGGNDGLLYALDKTSGAIKWTRNSHGNFTCPATFGNGIFIAATDLGIIERVNTDNGEIIWQYDTGNTIAGCPSPILSNGYVYFNSADGSLIALSLEHGSEVWSQFIQQPIISDPLLPLVPAVANDHLFIAIPDGEIIIFASDITQPQPTQTEIATETPTEFLQETITPISETATPFIATTTPNVTDQSDIDSLALIAPTLALPLPGFLTNDNTQDLSWNPVTGALSYEIQIDNLATFAAPIDQTAKDLLTTTYTAATLTDGLKYWRVRAYNTASEPGAWSVARYFTVDTVAPLPPALSLPLNNAAGVRATPAFSWLAAVGATAYQFQYVEANDFADPAYTSGVLGVLTHTPSPAMGLGTWYWRVKSRDAAGNWSDWSAYRTITILPMIPVAPVLTAPATASYTNDNTPDLSWNPVTGALSYEIQIDNLATFAAPIDQTAKDLLTTTYTAATLTDGLKYWRVRAYNTASEPGAWSIARYFTIDTIAPVKPFLTTPANNAVVHTTTPALAVDLITGANTYQFQLAVEDTFGTLQVDKITTSPTYTLTAAQTLPFGRVYWRVQAIDAAGNPSGWADPKSFVVNILKTPADQSYTTIKKPVFTWAAAVGALEYQIQVDDSASFDLPMVLDINRPVSITYTPTMDLPFSKLYWRMRVRTAAGWGDTWTSGFMFTITPPLPPAPSLISPVAGTRTDNLTPSFSWQSTVPNLYYQIQISKSLYFTPIMQDRTLDTNVVTYTATSLPAGKYYWRVRAFNYLDVPGAWSITRDFTRIILLPVLTSPINTEITSSLRPLFEWEDVSGASSYIIQIANNNAFNPILNTGTVTSSNYSPPEDLPANTTLYWRVQGLGLWGPSNLSGYQTFITANPPSIPALSFPLNVNISSYSPTLTWNTSSHNPLSYQVQVSLSSSFTTLVLDANTPNNHYMLPTGILGNLIQYYWRVRSFNDLDQYSSWSNSAWFRSPGFISGRITNSAGDGIGGIIIQVQGKALNGTSDSSGFFTIQGLVPGTYTIIPTDSNFLFTPKSIISTLTTTNINGKNFNIAEKLTVTGKVVLDPRAQVMMQGLELQDGDVSGLTNEGVSNVTVKDNQGNITTTGSDGTYIIDDATSGNYTISLAKAGYSSIPVNRSFFLTNDALAQYFMITPLLNPSTKMVYATLYGNVRPSFSANGRFVVIPQSSESGRVLDLYTGSQIIGIGINAVISGDGRYIAYSQSSNNIVSVFIGDRDTDENGIFDEAGNIDTWDTGVGNADRPDISQDGRTVVFSSGNTVFIHDVWTRETFSPESISSGFHPQISATGRYVVFQSWDNLLPEDQNTGTADVYVYDRDADGNDIFDEAGNTSLELVSISTTGLNAPNNIGWETISVISGDGRYVVFKSYNLDPNIVDFPLRALYIRDRQSHTTKRIPYNVTITGCTKVYLDAFWPKMTPDGRFITFYARTYCNSDSNYLGEFIYLYDRDTDQNGVFDETSRTKFEKVNLLLPNIQAQNPNISADGRYIIFPGAVIENYSPTEAGVYIHDRGTNLNYSVTGRVTDGYGSPVPGVSIDAGNGRMAFTDQDGYYSLLGLPGGTYYLRPTITDLVFSPTKRVVVVPPNSTGQDFNVTTGYVALSSLSGRITDLYGQPIEGVSVDIGHGSSVLTDNQGEYTITELLDGEYTLAPTKEGWEFYPAPIIISVHGEDIGGLNYTAIKVFDISGKITKPDGSGIEGVLISTGFGHEATSDSEGSFTIYGVPLGGFTLTVIMDGYTFEPNWRYVEIISGDLTNTNFIGQSP